MSKDRIFISYRRNDEAGWIAKLSDVLSQRFGRETVFKDNETITVGNDFASLIDQVLSETTALVVVIGKNWKGRSRWKLGQRIWDEDDWVRKEIEFAGKNISRIFPVLVHGASLPTKNEIPPTLAFLSNIQAFELRRDYWDDDVVILLRQIEKSLREQPETPEAIAFRRNEIVSEQIRRHKYRMFDAFYTS